MRPERHKVHLTLWFDAPVETIFTALADHEQFGRLIGQSIQRVRAGQPPDLNGLGSVRRIKIVPGIYFEETITAFEQPSYIAYQVTKGSPITDHLGELQFSELSGRTRLDYTIRFRPRWPIPGWGRLLCSLIERPIRKGLERFAASLLSAR
ncbi:SRPBCC family protein [Aestuariibacter halophilus]|uniref:SRPBCC family protein n=1 Tax=Fluctibacter halophilus TaxID=226011 RepID=A0ABS8GAB2_9ALTE|nr:SRPBCC family protein [Aestuariibacter halophilus]MCC2617096.1 SRPBCC family protein [Aestuariibacter halophilus]